MHFVERTITSMNREYPLTNQLRLPLWPVYHGTFSVKPWWYVATPLVSQIVLCPSAVHRSWVIIWVSPNSGGYASFADKLLEAGVVLPHNHTSAIHVTELNHAYKLAKALPSAAWIYSAATLSHSLYDEVYRGWAVPPCCKDQGDESCFRHFRAFPQNHWLQSVWL